MMAGDHTSIQLSHLLESKEMATGADPPYRFGQGGMHPYVNKLSARQMESLTAICDTLWPCMAVPHSKFHASLFTYYRTSASMAGTPERLGGLISERLHHPALRLLRLALWMLSTWFGTFILCGILSLSTEFPYFQSFSQLSQKKREQILRSWSSSYFYLSRMLFYSVKMLVLLVFFTQFNDNYENPTWKAMDYPGPDPDFRSASIRRPNLQQNEPKGNKNDRDLQGHGDAIGPLHKGIIDLKHPKDMVQATLKRSGFPVSITSGTSTTANNIYKPSLTIHCDAVVVGSGSGGGVAAGVLAKAGYKVLVLEQGNYFARTTLSLLEGPSLDQMYQGAGFVATRDLGVVILAGSTVGGGSTVNWSASIKTPQHVIDEWSDKYELELFGSELYNEALGAVCDQMGVQSEIQEEGLNNSVLRRGCVELGYPVVNIPRNAPADHYCGWCCFGCKDGRKKGTAETWLVDAVESGNGVILPCSKALKVLYRKSSKRKIGRKQQKIATGVIFEHDDGTSKRAVRYLVKSKVTVVAAGALETPALLKRSGLRNPNIGKHLHLHPVAMAWGYFPAHDDHNDDYVNKKSYEGGIMTAMSTVVGDLEGSGYGAVIQTPSLHPGMFSVVMPWTSAGEFKERMRKFSRTAHVFALARDEGEGQVMSKSSISYKLEERDEEKLKKGLEKCVRILAAAGAEEIGTHHREGKKINVKKASSHEFERFVKEEIGGRSVGGMKSPICSAHQMGSCRMGVDESGSVVNQRGETWEVEGLYLADSSVFPTALGVNPMLTIQAIAYCTAQSIVEVLRRKKKKMMK